MRLGFCISVLLLSTTFSGLAFTAQPDIHSHSALRHGRQIVSQPIGDISDHPDIDSAQPNEIIFSMNKNHFASEAGNTDDTNGKSGPATLPNALWLLGFGIIFLVLTTRRTMDNSNVT